MRLHRFYRSLFVVLNLLMGVGLLLCAPATLTAGTQTLTILHSNDHHGHFAKFDTYPVKAVGGLATQSTLVQTVRAEAQKNGGHVLVLSGGDINTGVPESDMLDAEPDILAMNLIGYDAMVLGNHEFDNPLSVLFKQQKWAEFPFLAANVRYKADQRHLVKPYVIKDFEGLKVAILGLVTPETPVLVTPDNIKSLQFEDPLATARRLVPELREKADLVIALTHLGYRETLTGTYRTGPGDVQLAQAVPDIDIIVGGHSHTSLKEARQIGQTLIVQAGEWSKYMGRLDVTIDTDTNRITTHRSQLLPVNLKTRVTYADQHYYLYKGQAYVEDQRLLELLVPFESHADQLLSQPVGKALTPLVGDRTQVRSRETNLANLITDAMRAKTGTQIALMNAGGIRADISPGTITYRDILKVQPFGNTLVKMRMTGAQIMTVLDFAASLPPGKGGFLQVSGLNWTRAQGRAENVRVGDAPLDLDQRYSVVTNSFMAAGGDGYKMLPAVPQEDTGFVDASALREHIAGLGTIDQDAAGRLQFGN